MNRKLLLFAASLLMSAGIANAQWTNNAAWNYSFGTGTGTFTTLGTNSSSNAITAGFLPITPSGNAGVYINSAATSGSFTLNGDESLTEKLATANGMVRFSVNSVAGATDVVMNSFKIKFSAPISTADAGNYIYAIGNHKGNLFNVTSNNSVYRASNELFTALRWTPTATANSTTIKFEYRIGSDASTTTTYSEINSTSFVKGNEYEVTVYCNNSSISQTYTVASTPYTLPTNTFHIWVGGVKLGADFPRSIETNGTGGIGSGTSIAVANGSALNSFLVSGAGATGATGSIMLKSPKFIYSVTVNPVSFISFSGKKSANGISLNWATASEQNNDYFELSRSADGNNFVTVGRVNSKGSTSEVSNYTLMDRTPASGINYYQLKQVDKDGTSSFYKEIIRVDFAIFNDELGAFAAKGKLNLSAFATTADLAELSVFDLKGTKVLASKLQLKAGENQFSVDADQLPAGLLIVRIKGNYFNKTIKVMK